MEEKVDIHELKPGMYIARLDRPWLETPFLFQGFLIQDHNDIAELQRHCKFVYIDIEKGEPAKQYLDIKSGQPQRADADLKRICRSASGNPAYPDTVSVEEELAPARDSHHVACERISNILDDVRCGRKLNVVAAEQAVNNMIESILRNPDAYMWLTKLKNKDSYTYAHSIDACALAITFGRHLGLPRQELEQVAVGTLLFDIGKMKLPEELLDKPGRLSEEEFALMQEHVAHSVHLMADTKGISPTSIEVAYSHHERHNGLGYPRGLTSEKTSVYGKIAAIVDCYDAITSDRPYSVAVSPHEAIRSLYEWRNVDFQEELVEQFIQCLGVYPTGTLVELNTGQVGIVLSQNRVRRLRPKVMLVLNADKHLYNIAPTV
ncbi:MAG: HD-GYP domain-containing protein, partial [Gammaproteobacteria bacterium]|nr:HD-GYP domain-containing protein [Gammaproteobacteria bacterium]